MITPLMHILSCLDDKYNVIAPLNIFYLTKNDRDLIIKEAKRIGSFFNNEDLIWISESPSGLKMVSDTQVIAGSAVKINPYTALLLTRVWKCFQMYIKEIDEIILPEVESDLSNDAVVLRLEGNPSYIYSFVFSTMETKSLSFESRIGRLQEVLSVIQSHSVVQDSNFLDENSKRRLEVQSNLNYWRNMLLIDYPKYYGEAPKELSFSDFDTIKKEMNNLGFYGFVNPKKMFLDFSGSRVTKKSSINISEEVVNFLSKVVLSGGTVYNEKFN